MDHQESSQVLGSGPSSASLSHPAAINQLPQELIIVIFHLCFDRRKTVKVRTRLVLVCRYWKAIIEGTPSFWTHITGADGLQHARNAIMKTGESPIDLTLNVDNGVPVGEFLAAVSEKVSRWRSVNLIFDFPWPASFGGLQTSACHSLEKLSLIWNDLSMATRTLTLFNGGPAPDALKDVFFWGIPANLAPMGLSKLSSLALLDVPSVTMDDLLVILRDSPTLTILNLQRCRSLDTWGGSVGLPIILGSLTACDFELWIPEIRFLLSAIHAPSLDHLKLTFDMEHSIPDSSLFSPPPPEFEPTLKRLLSAAKQIELRFGNGGFSINFGGLKLFLNSPAVDGFQYFREVLDSLMDYSREKGKDLKVRLHLDCVDVTIEGLQILNRYPMVEQLTLTEDFWTGLVPKNAIGALGTCVAAGPHEWLFPELEVIDWDISLENIEKLETALEKRYCAAQSARQVSAKEHQHPRLLKELRFFSNYGREKRSLDMERARRLHVLAGGAKIFVRDTLVDFDTPES